jgi:hypothetical protein
MKRETQVNFNFQPYEEVAMLTFRDGSQTKIVSVNFTYALPGGMWIKDEYGQTEWVSDSQGSKDYPQWSKWLEIAHQNGMTGMWYAV